MIKKFLAFAVVAALFVACDKEPEQKPNNDKEQTENTDPEEEEEEEFKGAVAIDGDFADWDALEDGQVAVATLPTEGTLNYPVMKTLKLHADELYIYVCIEFDPRGQWVEALGAYSGVRYLDLFIDQDNDPTTGRYYAWSNCSSIMLQGAFNGTETPYNPGVDLYTGADMMPEWAWEDLGLYGVVTSVLPVVVSEDKALFECSLLRPAMAMDMAPTIGMGAIVETEDWSSIGQLPQLCAEDMVVEGDATAENRPAMLYIDLPEME
jgi:hypothetical protein